MKYAASMCHWKEQNPSGGVRKKGVSTGYVCQIKWVLSVDIQCCHKCSVLVRVHSCPAERVLFYTLQCESLSYRMDEKCNSYGCASGSVFPLRKHCTIAFKICQCMQKYRGR